MAFSVQIEINDRATPRIEGAERALAPQARNQVVGRAGVNRVQRHLFAKNASSPNKLGGKRTNFYSKAARATNYRMTADGVVVVISQLGMRQRYQGGVIVPRRAKRLTIPAAAEAHGKRAGEFSDLKFGFAAGADGKERPALVQEATGKAMFWLSKRVVQKPDRTVIPTGEEIKAEVVKALGIAVRMASRRRAGGAA